MRQPLRAFFAGSIVLSFTVSTLAQNTTTAGDPACPGNGSCCVAHGGSGCDNNTCCNIVCSADFFCCLAWDSDCVALADQLCGAVCAGSCPGTGDCCSTHKGGGCEIELCCDLVCLEIPACCESGWSAACASLANQVCQVCEKEPPIVCPQPGECCTGRFFTGGCEREACCRTVCEIDDFCCIREWDIVCANVAIDHCLNVCDCPEFGNFDDHPPIDLRDAAAFQNCFSGGASSPVAPECACADYDGDGDADLRDFDVFVDQMEP